jgi:hypothetical protein
MESKVLEAMESSLQMDATSEESLLRRDLSCANVEYLLRTMEISDMKGSRSEAWAMAHKERKGE